MTPASAWSEDNASEEQALSDSSTEDRSDDELPASTPEEYTSSVPEGLREWAQSGEAERQLTAERAENFARWMQNMVKRYVEKFDVADDAIPGERMFPDGYPDEQMNKRRPGPTVQDWLRSIPDPPRNNRDLLSPPEGGSPSMGQKEATSASVALELHRLPKGVSYEQWEAYATDIFKIYEGFTSSGKLEGPRREEDWIDSAVDVANLFNEEDAGQ